MTDASEDRRQGSRALEGDRTASAGNVNRLLVAKGLRAFGDGFVSLLLPAWLLELGFDALQVGIIATVTLLGSGVMTLMVGLHAWRLDRRSLLLAAAVLMAATGLGFALMQDLWPLLLIAFVGTLNPSGGDVSVFLPLEHALLGDASGARDRTAVFARYSLVGALLAAFGSLAAAIPVALGEYAQVPAAAGMQAMFALYAVLGLCTALVYARLATPRPLAPRVRAAALGPSKRIVYRLAALFSLDAFGGGLVVQSMVALWLYQRFGLSLASAASMFFWTGLLTAFSYLAAVRIADRFGLVRTMVFTHLPANLCLMAIPFVADLRWVMVLLFVRSALSQMDVPTRSSYVMAVVTPDERAAAASLTAVPRTLAAAIGPSLAGQLLSVSTFGWPLLVAGGIKVVYDVLLLATFHKVRPPEEAERS